MPEMDITHTEFDPKLDEPRWNVAVSTTRNYYEFKRVDKQQRDKLFQLTLHHDYDYDTGKGCHDYINGKVVERVIITAATTDREEQQYMLDRAKIMEQLSGAHYLDRW